MQHGRTWEHRGPRSKEGLQALVDRMTAPPVKQLALPRDLDELRKASNNGVAFVLGYATGGEHADRAQISGVGHSLFTEVARRQQHMLTFGETESPSVLEAASLPMDATSAISIANTISESSSAAPRTLQRHENYGRDVVPFLVCESGAPHPTSYGFRLPEWSLHRNIANSVAILATGW